MMLGLKGTSPTVARVSLTEKKISVSLTGKKKITPPTVARVSLTQGGEDLFVFNDTIEGPRAPLSNRMTKSTGI